MRDDYDAMADDELLVRTAREPEAFGAFYRRHLDLLLAFCRRRTGSAESAADVVAEVFAAALVACDRLDRERGSAAQWLRGIASHKIADLHRHGHADRRLQRRLKMREIAWSEDDLSHVADVASRASADGLLGELPEAERLAVTARVLDEREYDDIARASQQSAAVVRKRVSRGLARMRNWIGEAQ